MLVPKATATWKELDEYASSVPYHVKEFFLEKQLTPSDILKDYYSGTQVIIQRLSPLYNCDGCICATRDGWNIKISHLLSPYERDKTLFHELAHIHHIDFFFSRYGRLPPKGECTEAIVEWAGRHWRSDPELLRTAVLTFALEPNIYDLSSLLAFSHYEKAKGLQCLLPFEKDAYIIEEEEPRTFMD